MNESANSLERLHDVVMPVPVSLWPPAPGWYVVIGIVFAAFVILGYRSWSRWRSSAYRRVALRELDDADSPAQISELLRRAALSRASREEVSGLIETDWTDWLAARCPSPMPEEVRVDLSFGAYRPGPTDADFPALREYARNWLLYHDFTTSDS